MDNERTDEFPDDAPPLPPSPGEPEPAAEPDDANGPNLVDETGIVDAPDAVEQTRVQDEAVLADQPSDTVVIPSEQEPTHALDETIDASTEDEEVARTNAKKRPGGMSTGGKVAIVLTSVLVVLGIAYAGTAWYIQDKVPNNTSVDGVAIGGMDSAAAITKINTEFASRPVEPLPVVAGERALDLDPVALGLTVDGEAIVQPLVRFSLDPRDIWNHFVGLGAIDPVAAIDREAAEATLVSVLPDLEVEPVEGSIVLTDGAAEVTDGVDAVRVDVPSSIDAIAEGWLFAEGPVELPTVTEEPEISAADVAEAMTTIVEPLLSGPVTVTAGEASEELSTVDLTAVSQLVPESGALTLTVDSEALHAMLLERNEGFATQGEDAQIVLSNGAPTIIPSKAGEQIDQEQLAQAVVAAGISADQRTAAAEFVVTEPEFTTADAEALQVVEKVSEFSTPLTADNVRTRNLINGSEKISNTLVLPGETFSLIDALGPVTAARGFVTSGVVENGFYTTALGGGLSQLSTTTYNAAYFAGMDIVSHKPHSRWFSRYPEGREATMWSPDLDMKFKNGTPYGVLVQAWTEGGRQWVRFWSTEYYTVETFTGARYGITSPRTVYNSSPECKPESGGQSGFSVNGWRKRFLNGEQFDHWDWSWTYQPWNNVVCGTAP